MTITLTPEVESAIVERARREGMTPKQLVSDSLRNLFVTPKPPLDEILGLAAQVYAGLSEQEVLGVEKIMLDRSYFAGERRLFSQSHSEIAV